MADPFNAVKDEVALSSRTLGELYDRWKKCSSESEASPIVTELTAALRSIEWDLQDLDEAIGVVENDKQNRYTVSAEELRTRKAFVEGVRRQAQSIKDALQPQQKAAPVAATREKDREALLGSSKHERQKQYEAETMEANDNFVAGQQQLQQVLVDRQDQDLEELGASARRLGEMGTAIQTELKEQVFIIDGLENRVETVSDRLRVAQKHVQELLNTPERGKLGTIGVLIVVFLVLLILLVYT